MGSFNLVVLLKGLSLKDGAYIEGWSLLLVAPFNINWSKDVILSVIKFGWGSRDKVNNCNYTRN